MENVSILWADDEIELLKPHLIFLQEKGYVVQTANNGQDALDLVRERHFDLVLLDENMPGMGGLETLAEIKAQRPELPVVMVTKSEEEHIMESAIGGKIADYLIKPVRPNQLLMSVKKIIDSRRLVQEQSSQQYIREFREIGMRIGGRMNFMDWDDVYRKLVYWEMELAESKNTAMLEILTAQKQEANQQFVRAVQRAYPEWLAGGVGAPLMSHRIFKEKVQPLLRSEPQGPVFWVVIDNLRWDQWRIIWPMMSDAFRIKEETMTCSILPTATQYARNAMFAGMLPDQIKRKFPQYWIEEDEEGSKNAHEESLLREQLKSLGLNSKMAYHKITNLQSGKRLLEQFSNLSQNALNVIVYNFVDMLSHARTDMEVIQELAADEEGYRSVTRSWFANSPLQEMIRKAAEMKSAVVISTDHGTIRVNTPIQVVGDRNTSTNLRYKMGKNLRYNPAEVVEFERAELIGLPKSNVSSRYIFADTDRFFAYPNNYNYYVNLYRNTFQHGGVSLEEMLIPLAVLESK